MIALGYFGTQAGAARHGVLQSMQRAAQPDVGSPTTTIKAPWAALVVDDDAGVRQSLRLCLEAAGARVLGVATGRAALEALDRGHFDVVFLDLWLGAEAGLDLLPQMLARQSDLGVIVVTAFASIESAVNAVRRGAVDYVPKPFTPDQVRLAAVASSMPSDCGAGWWNFRKSWTRAASRHFRLSQPTVSQIPPVRCPRGRIRRSAALARREWHGQERLGPLDPSQQSASRCTLCDRQRSVSIRRPHDERPFWSS